MWGQRGDDAAAVRSRGLLLDHRVRARLLDDRQAVSTPGRSGASASCTLAVPYLAWTLIYYGVDLVIAPYPPFSWVDPRRSTSSTATPFTTCTSCSSPCSCTWSSRCWSASCGPPPHRAGWVLVGARGRSTWRGSPSLAVHPVPSGTASWFWNHAYELLPTYTLYVLAGCYAALYLPRLQRLLRGHPGRALAARCGLRGGGAGRLRRAAAARWTRGSPATCCSRRWSSACAAAVVLLGLVGDPVGGRPPARPAPGRGRVGHLLRRLPGAPPRPDRAAQQRARATRPDHAARWPEPGVLGPCRPSWRWSLGATALALARPHSPAALPLVPVVRRGVDPAGGADRRLTLRSVADVGSMAPGTVSANSHTAFDACDDHTSGGTHGRMQRREPDIRSADPRPQRRRPAPGRFRRGGHGRRPHLGCTWSPPSTGGTASPTPSVRAAGSGLIASPTRSRPSAASRGARRRCRGRTARPGLDTRRAGRSGRRLGLTAVGDASPPVTHRGLAAVDRWVVGVGGAAADGRSGTGPAARRRRRRRGAADGELRARRAHPRSSPSPPGSCSPRPRAVADGHGLGRRTTVGYSPLPLFHINGLVVGVLSTVVTGGRLVVDRRFSASRFWATVDRQAVTWLNLVPAIITVLAGCDAPSAEVTERVGFARSASAPLPAATREALRAPLRHRRGRDLRHDRGGQPDRRQPGRPGTADAPAPSGLPVGRGAACGRATAARWSHAGRPGRCRSGRDAVVSRYWSPAHRPARRPAAAGPDGWLATGDLGSVDSDGYVYLAGRVDDVINRGGEKVLPREVEEVLLADPAVDRRGGGGPPPPGRRQGAGRLRRRPPDAGATPRRVDDLAGAAGRASPVSRFKRPAEIIVAGCAADRSDRQDQALRPPPRRRRGDRAGPPRQRLRHRRRDRRRRQCSPAKVPWVQRPFPDPRPPLRAAVPSGCPSTQPSPVPPG